MYSIAIRCRQVVAATFVAAFLVCVASGCSNAKHVSGEEFVRLAKKSTELNSAKSTAYIGTTGVRAYLEYFEAPFFYGDGITIYWTQLSELPPTLAADLKAGENPWAWHN